MANSGTNIAGLWRENASLQQENQALHLQLEQSSNMINRLKEQHVFIIRECEASSTQSKRILRIKARAEGALNGTSPKFSGVHDRRDDKIRHIQQLQYMNAQLEAQIKQLLKDAT